MTKLELEEELSDGRARTVGLLIKGQEEFLIAVGWILYLDCGNQRMNLHMW